MRHRAGEALVAAAVVFIFFGVIDANIVVNEVALDPSNGTPPAVRVIPMGPSSSACAVAADRSASCRGAHPSSPPADRMSAW